MGKSELQRLKRQQPVPSRPDRGRSELPPKAETTGEGELGQVGLVKRESLGGHPYLPGEESWEDITWFEDVA